MQLSPPKQEHGAKTSTLANAIAELKQEDDALACPKPRRAAPSLPEFLYPITCKHSHSTTASRQGSNVVMDMIAGKNDQRECVNVGCEPSCYCGSPPTRLGNPLVHDANFLRQEELLQSYSRRKLLDKVGLAPTSPI